MKMSSNIGILVQIEFIDHHRNVTLSQEQQAKPIEMYQLTIGYLKKYTNYSVRINCATKIGSGPWSSPMIYVQTLEDGMTSPKEEINNEFFFFQYLIKSKI